LYLRKKLIISLLEVVFQVRTGFDPGGFCRRNHIRRR
jgi:hypothetical protein